MDAMDIAAYEAAIQAEARNLTREAIIRRIVRAASSPSIAKLTVIYRRELDCRGESA